MTEFELTSFETLKKTFETALRNESKIDTLVNALAELLSEKRNESFEKVMHDLTEEAQKNYQASLERLALKSQTQ